MNRRLVGGLSVVAALALLMLYGALQAQIEKAADQANGLASRIDQLESKTDDLESRTDNRYGYGY